MTWPKNTNTKTKTLTKTNTFRKLHQRAVLETCDLWDIWSEWWGDMTWPKKDDDKDKDKDKHKHNDDVNGHEDGDGNDDDPHHHHPLELPWTKMGTATSQKRSLWKMLWIASLSMICLLKSHRSRALLRDTNFNCFPFFAIKLQERPSNIY